MTWWREALVAGSGLAGRADRVEQRVAALVLADGGGDAGEGRGDGQLVAAHGGVQDDSWRVVEVRQHGGQREPVPARVVEVDQQHVGSRGPQEGPELLLGRRLADVPQVLRGVDDGPHPGTNRRVVVQDRDAQRRHAGALLASGRCRCGWASRRASVGP